MASQRAISALDAAIDAQCEYLRGQQARANILGGATNDLAGARMRAARFSGEWIEECDQMDRYAKALVEVRNVIIDDALELVLDAIKDPPVRKSKKAETADT